MFERLLHNKHLRSRTIAEVHLNVLQGDELDINLLVFRKRKDILEIGKTVYGIHDLEDLQANLSRNIPLSLIIDGKGVLQKTIEKQVDQPAISQILPNANSEEFIVQEHPLTNNRTYVTIARKESVRTWIDKFTDYGYFIIDIRIGPAIINCLRPLLPEDQKVIKVRNYCVTFDHNGIFEISKNGFHEENYRYIIEEQSLSGSDMIPFAAAVSYYKDSPDTGTGTYALFRDISTQFILKTIHQQSVRVFLVVLLVILLLNFLMYSHYAAALAEAGTRYEANRENFEKYEELNNEYSRQQSFLLESDALGNTVYSYYADRLAYLLPADIVLSELSFNPVSDKIRAEKLILYDKNNIKLSGETGNSFSLNRYIRLIENEAWVNEIKLGSFSRESDDGPGLFEVSISFEKDE